MSLQVGMKFGDFIIKRECSQNSAEAIYEVIEEESGQPFLLKVLKDPAERAALIREAKILSKLDHPGIVKLKSTALNHKPPYLVKEFIRGQTLRQLLDVNGRLPWRRVEVILEDLLQALQYAHGKGFIHGNLNPNAITLDAHGRAFLTSFQSQLSFAATAQDNVELSLLEQEWGQKSAYKAPEFFKVTDVDVRCDLYSLGVLLFEMLCNHLPDLGAKPRDVLPDLPPRFDELFTRSYCDRDQRFRDAGEFLEQLEKFDKDLNCTTHDSSMAAIAAVQVVEQGKQTDPLIGYRFGPYEIRTKIGEGGMGAVYKGFHSHLEKDVAIKVLDLRKLQNQRKSLRYVERFRREAKIAAKLEHPSIVSTLDFGEKEHFFYLVMAFIEGESLQDYLARRRRLGVEEALKIVTSIAQGLGHAHERGIVHRDIKPGNILLSKDLKAYIADFGLVKSLEEEGQALTSPGMVVGTPAFMAPEQCLAQGDIDGRTDFFSLGLVLYQCLSGEVPVEGKFPGQILRNRVDKDLPPLTKHRPKLDRRINDLVMQMLVRDRDQRLGVAGLVVPKLEALLALFSSRGEGRKPDLGLVTELLVNDSLGDFVEDAEDRIARGDFQYIDRCLEKAEGERGTDEKLVSLKKHLSLLQEQMNTYFVQAEEKRRQGKNEEALAFLEVMAQKCPQDPRLRSAIEGLQGLLNQRDQLLEHAQQAFKKGRDEWGELVDEAFGLLPGDKHVLYSQVEMERLQSRIDELLARATEDERAGRFKDANERLERGLALAPENPVLLQRIVELEKRRRRARVIISVAALVLLLLGSFFVLKTRAQGAFDQSVKALQEGRTQEAREHFELAISPFPFLIPEASRRAIEKLIGEQEKTGEKPKEKE
jgi:serine/threonine protein kinase